MKVVLAATKCSFKKCEKKRLKNLETSFRRKAPSGCSERRSEFTKCNASETRTEGIEFLPSGSPLALLLAAGAVNFYNKLNICPVVVQKQSIEHYMWFCIQ